MKIGPTRAKLFHADERKDRHDLEIRRFWQIFANATNSIRIQYSIYTWKDLSVLRVSIVAICTICQSFSLEEKVCYRKIFGFRWFQKMSCKILILT